MCCFPGEQGRVAAAGVTAETLITRVLTERRRVEPVLCGRRRHHGNDEQQQHHHQQQR